MDNYLDIVILVAALLITLLGSKRKKRGAKTVVDTSIPADDSLRETMPEAFPPIEVHEPLDDTVAAEPRVDAQPILPIRLRSVSTLDYDFGMDQYALPSFDISNIDNDSQTADGDTFVRDYVDNFDLRSAVLGAEILTPKFRSED